MRGGAPHTRPVPRPTPLARAAARPRADGRERERTRFRRLGSPAAVGAQVSGKGLVVGELHSWLGRKGDAQGRVGARAEAPAFVGGCSSPPAHLRIPEPRGGGRFCGLFCGATRKGSGRRAQGTT